MNGQQGSMLVAGFPRILQTNINLFAGEHESALTDGQDVAGNNSALLTRPPLT